MKRIKLCLITMAVCLPLFGGEDNLRIAAYVDREIITAGELKLVVGGSPEGRELNRLFQGDDLAQRWRNLERRKLQEMITQKLIAREARKRIGSVPQRDIDSRIAAEVHVRNFNDRDDLRRFLRESGVSWEKWIRQIEDFIFVEQYEGYMTRRQHLVSPEETKAFYKQHIGKEKIEHRSVDGYLRRVILQESEVARVNHIIIKPNLLGEIRITTLEELSKIHARMRVVAQKFNQDPPKDPKVWVQQTQENNPEMEIIFVESQECPKGSGTLGNLDERAFTQDFNVWSRAELVLEPTQHQDVQTERWDIIQTLSIHPGRRLPFRDVRDSIINYLRLSIRDREMQILKETLWKKHSVKIVDIS